MRVNPRLQPSPKAQNVHLNPIRSVRSARQRPLPWSKDKVHLPPSYLSPHLIRVEPHVYKDPSVVTARYLFGTDTRTLHRLTFSNIPAFTKIFLGFTSIHGLNIRTFDAPRATTPPCLSINHFRGVNGLTGHWMRATCNTIVCAKMLKVSLRQSAFNTMPYRPPF